MLPITKMKGGIFVRIKFKKVKKLLTLLIQVIESITLFIDSMSEICLSFNKKNKKQTV